VTSHLHKPILNGKFTVATVESVNKKVRDKEAWRHHFKPNGIFNVTPDKGRRLVSLRE
jgi:hypothetical protein